MELPAAGDGSRQKRRTIAGGDWRAGRATVLRELEKLGLRGCREVGKLPGSRVALLREPREVTCLAGATPVHSAPSPPFSAANRDLVIRQHSCMLRPHFNIHKRSTRSLIPGFQPPARGMNTSLPSARRKRGCSSVPLMPKQTLHL